MAYNVNSLIDYVQQDRLPLLGKSILGGRTIRLVNRQSGVKGKANLNIVDINAPLQAGKACGFTAQGDDVFTTREIRTEIIKVNKSWCWSDLIGKWAEYEYRIDAGDKTLAFEEHFTTKIVEAVHEQLEKAVWQGLTVGSANLIDGFLKNLTDASVTPITLAGTTAYDRVMEVYNAIPEAVLDKSAIFVSASLFRQLVGDMVAKNYYHYNPEAPTDEVVLFGTNTKVYKTNGLNNATMGGKSDLIVATDPMNLFYGYDVEDSDTNFEIWYEKKDEAILFKMKFNAGTQVAFPSEVVVGGV